MVRQRTDYPWDGRVHLTLLPERPVSLTLYLRIPRWSPSWSISINGSPPVENPASLISGSPVPGYAAIDRVWSPGDTVELALAMPVQRVYGHPRSRELLGRVALQRGPVVYCLEQADNGPGLDRVVLPAQAEVQSHFDETLLGGVVVLSAVAEGICEDGWEGGLYRPVPPVRRQRRITAVPYFAWDNREPGEMKVWLRERP